MNPICLGFFREYFDHTYIRLDSEPFVLLLDILNVERYSVFEQANF